VFTDSGTGIASYINKRHSVNYDLIIFSSHRIEIPHLKLLYFKDIAHSLIF
jgi:hypothetical protein